MLSYIKDGLTSSDNFLFAHRSDLEGGSKTTFDDLLESLKQLEEEPKDLLGEQKKATLAANWSTCYFLSVYVSICCCFFVCLPACLSFYLYYVHLCLCLCLSSSVYLSVCLPVFCSDEGLTLETSAQ